MPGMPGMPGLAMPGTMPGLGGMPGIPGMAAPPMPAMQGAPMPMGDPAGMPMGVLPGGQLAAGAMPGQMPSMPSMQSMPSIPSMPSMPAPGSMPALPAVMNGMDPSAPPGAPPTEDMQEAAVDQALQLACTGNAEQAKAAVAGMADAQFMPAINARLDEIAAEARAAQAAASVGGSAAAQAPPKTKEEEEEAKVAYAMQLAGNGDADNAKKVVAGMADDKLMEEINKRLEDIAAKAVAEGKTPGQAPLPPPPPGVNIPGFPPPMDAQANIPAAFRTGKFKVNEGVESSPDQAMQLLAANQAAQASAGLAAAMLPQLPSAEQMQEAVVAEAMALASNGDAVAAKKRLQGMAEPGIMAEIEKKLDEMAAAALANQSQYMQQAQFYQALRQDEAQRFAKGDPTAKSTSRFSNNFKPLRLCENFWKIGLSGCWRGNDCTFAHAYDELHPYSPDLPTDASVGGVSKLAEQDNVTRANQEPPAMRLRKKREMCTNFSEGKCILTKHCPFAHSEAELGTTEVVYIDKVRTMICQMWKQNKCVWGKNCTSAHGMEEIGTKRPAFMGGNLAKRPKMSMRNND
eukprot:gnl/TRDRNA2_/TRDRNA2_43062_c0_seq1.p1 gnl/TRDRNA2_/TRDRNA2_43062_c0~~gnl/TRDRNA2_/TRDRNA2_43062_c0_seq1.p1  ORF type:complete len:634 (-),score=167.63 gnl/TRDRNA2_/TRDRNA2_43062_c0_seq1:156-1874(-)